MMERAPSTARPRGQFLPCWEGSPARGGARWAAQYSSASMMVSARVVTAGSVGSGEPRSRDHTSRSSRSSGRRPRRSSRSRVRRADRCLRRRRRTHEPSQGACDVDRAAWLRRGGDHDGAADEGAAEGVVEGADAVDRRNCRNSAKTSPRRSRSSLAQWKVIQTVRERFSCRQCEAFTQPPAPFRRHAARFRRPGPSGDDPV